MVKKNMSFLALWASQSTYRLGDGFYVLAVVTLMYMKTQSVLCTALFPFVKAITSLISGSLAPLPMRRFPLRRLLMATQSAQAIILFGLIVFLHYFGFNLIVVAVFVIALAFIEGWCGPSRSAMLPRIVKEEDLVKANSLIGTTDKTASFLGFTLGGISVAAFGTLNVLWGALVLLVCAGFLTLRICDPSNDQVTNQQKKSSKGLKETWSFVYKHPIYRRLFLIDGIENIAYGAFIGAITLAFVKEILQKSEAWWGFLNGSYLFGSVVGGIVTITLSGWLKNNMKVAFILSSVNLAVMTTIFGFSVEPILPLIMMFLIGAPAQVRDVALQTLLQTNADKKQLPQIFAAHSVIYNVSWAMGMVLMALVAEYFGPRSVYVVSAGLVVFSVVVIITLPIGQRSKSSYSEKVNPSYEV